MSCFSIFQGHLLVKSGTEGCLLKNAFEKLQTEFILCDEFDPAYIAYLCGQGFMPMAATINNRCFLLIKLHLKRMLIMTHDFRFSKSIRKKSSNLVLTINSEFDSCLNHINQQHSDNWILPPLAAAFKQLVHRPFGNVNFYSIELTNENKLIAGEIGYTNGRVYSSLSGFYTQSGSGTMQLNALAALLRKNYFTIWDLGMDMPYKQNLGAKAYDRLVYLDTFQKAAQEKLFFSKNSYQVKELLTDIDVKHQ